MEPRSFDLVACADGGAGVRLHLDVVSEVPATIRVGLEGEIVSEISGFDLFECLLELRTELESRGLLLCCQGARRNVSPSGLTRQMSHGRLAYLLRLGKPPSDDDLVDVFAPAECSDVGSIDEQKQEIARIFRGT